MEEGLRTGETWIGNARNPRYGGYCIKYKQQWDGVEIAVSNIGNTELRCIDFVSRCCIKYKQRLTSQWAIVKKDLNQWGG